MSDREFTTLLAELDVLLAKCEQLDQGLDVVAGQLDQWADKMEELMEDDEFDDSEDEAFMQAVERGEDGDLYGEEDEIEIDDDEDWSQPFVGDNDHGDTEPTCDYDYEGGRA